MYVVIHSSIVYFLFISSLLIMFSQSSMSLLIFISFGGEFKSPAMNMELPISPEFCHIFLYVFWSYVIAII